MVTSKDRELFLNCDEISEPLLREDKVPAGVGDLWESVKENNERLEGLANARNMLGLDLRPEEKEKLIKQTESLAEMLMCADYLVGFPVSKLKFPKSEYDYFDSLPVRGEACGGKFRQMSDVLLKLEGFTWHILQLLLVVATLFVMQTGIDGRFSFLEIALLIATPVSFLFSEIWEEWPTKLLMHPIVLIVVGAYTVLIIVDSWSSSLPDYYFKIFIVYYGLVLVLMLLNYIVQIFKMLGNGKYKKEFCRLYEKDAEWMHRYVRFHVLWWNVERGTEPMPSRLKDMESEMDYFDRRYKQFK